MTKQSGIGIRGAATEILNGEGGHPEKSDNR
jgi:hypothetical protein